MLFINPWIYDFAAFDLWMKPLGLLYLARIFKNAGFKVDYIDCLDSKKTRRAYGCGKFNFEEIEKPFIYKDIPRSYKRFGVTELEFIKKLKSVEKPDVVILTSFMTYWYLGVFRVIEIVKEIYPDVPIMLGGIYANLCSEHAKKYSGADHVCSSTHLEEEYKLVCSITNKDYIPNNYPHTFLDYPYPYFEVVNNLEYGCILSSVGCIYNCSYCASPCLYPDFIQRKPGDIVRELSYFNTKLGLKDFAFYDDALLVNFDKHLREIYNGLKREALKFNFHAPNGLHTKMINKEVAKVLFDMNFKTLRLGFEFKEKNKQVITGGKVTNDDLCKAVEHLFDAGFTKENIGVYIIAGFKDQSIKELEQAIDFVKNMGVTPRINEYSSIPSTKDFNLPNNADPLFHNNKAFYYLSGNMTFKDMQYIKSISQDKCVEKNIKNSKILK